MNHPIQTAFKGTGAVGSALFAVITPSLGDLSEATRIVAAVVAIFGSIAFTASMCLDVARKTMSIRRELFQARERRDSEWEGDAPEDRADHPAEDDGLTPRRHEPHQPED